MTAKNFAGLISASFDWLPTADPHLHRFPSFASNCRILTVAVSATSVIDTRIRGHVKNAAPIGPDTGSRQWVSAVATHANAPFLIVDTVRSGDQRVAVSVPDAVWLKQCTPVIVDAIASTARALVAVNRAIAATSNTVAHDSNAITLDAELTDATAQSLRLMAPH